MHHGRKPSHILLTYIAYTLLTKLAKAILWCLISVVVFLGFFGEPVSRIEFQVQGST